jgi:hypothetical protein
MARRSSGTGDGGGQRRSGERERVGGVDSMGAHDAASQVAPRGPRGEQFPLLRPGAALRGAPPQSAAPGRGLRRWALARPWAAHNAAHAHRSRHRLFPRWWLPPPEVLRLYGLAWLPVLAVYLVAVETDGDLVARLQPVERALHGTLRNMGPQFPRCCCCCGRPPAG